MSLCDDLKTQNRILTEENSRLKKEFESYIVMYEKEDSDFNSAQSLGEKLLKSERLSPSQSKIIKDLE